MTSMFITRIFGASRIDRPGARPRQARSSRRFTLESLESRTALSGGLSSGAAAIDPYPTEVAPALVVPVQPAGTAKSAGFAAPATSRGADAASAADGIGMWDATITRPIAETYNNLLPLVSELLVGMAGSITLLGQAYRDGVPIPDLLDVVATTVGSTPADIPPEVIPLGVAAAYTAQQAGLALPTTVAGLQGIDAGSQVEGWISSAVGRIEALAAVDGSTPPDQAVVYGPPPMASISIRGEVAAYLKAGESSDDPGPPGPDPNALPVPLPLVSLGKFFFVNLNLIYNNYVGYLDNTSGLIASRPDGFGTDGVASISDATAATVQEAQDAGGIGAGWMPVPTAGARGPAVSQGPTSQGGAFRSADSSPEDPAPPASITAGEVPLDILLSDPEISAQGISAGVQQIAELIPIEASSLALVATLHSLPPESRSEPSDGEDRSGEPRESVPSSASPPPWAAFVIGLDEAFERSGDACAKALSDGARAEARAAVDARGEPLEWHRPIFPNAVGLPHQHRDERASPGASRADIDRPRPSAEADADRPLASLSSGDDDPVDRASPLDGSPENTAQGQPPIEGIAATAWAASGGALIAGWLWARSRARRGRDLASIDRDGPIRGGEDRVDPGS
jgi:hypothetical protein